MSNQLQITGGAKVRNLEGVITGTSGVLGALPINTASGIPQLDSNGKILVSQLPNSVMEFLGVWNASTNTPYLHDGTGNAGDVYLCNVAGTVNFGSGPITFSVGDYVVYTGSVWARSSGATGTVTSVAVSESSAALSITGSPITTSGTINIGFAGTSAQYVAGDGSLITFPALTGYVPYTGATADLNLGLHDLKTAKLWLYDQVEDGYASISYADEALNFQNSDGETVFYVEPTFAQFHKTATIQSNFWTSLLTTTRDHYLPDASGTLALTSDLSAYVPTSRTISTTSPLQGGGDLSANRTLSILQSSSTQSGYLSSTDWNTFNNKETSLSFYSPLRRSGSSITIDQSNSTTNGYLSSTDWNTFNGKQGTITLTTTGSSGASTFVSNTLNVPTYTLAGLGGQPQLNGTGFVKASGTTISYDNSTYLTTSAAASTYVPYTGATTNVLLGSYGLFSGGVQVTNGGSGVISTDGFLSAGKGIFLTDTVSGGSWSSGTTNIVARNSGLLITHNSGGGVLAFNTSTTYTYTFPNANGTIALTSDIPSLSGYVQGTGTTNYLPKFTGTSTIGNSAITDDGTTVSLLSRALSGVSALFTNATSGDYLTLRNSNPSIGGGEAISFVMDYTQSASSTGWKILSRYAGGNLQFVPNYQNAGYNTPALSLNYNGAATFSSSVTALSGIFGNSGSGSYSLRVVNNDQSNVRINIANTGSGGQEFSIIGGLAGASNAGFSIYDNTNAATRMYITSGGNALIGTTTDAGYKLDVNGTGRFSGALQVQGGLTVYSTSSDLQLLIGNGTRDMYISGATGAGTSQMIGIQNVSSANVVNIYDGKLKIASTGAATFSSSVTAGGNITSNISALYTSQLTLTNSYSSTQHTHIGAFGGNSYWSTNWYYNSGAAFDDNTKNSASIVLNADGTINLNTINAGNTNPNTRVFIGNTGNVGIGTTSPTQALTVNGNAAVGAQQAFWLRDDDGFSSNSARRAWAMTANYVAFGMLSFYGASAANSNPLSGTPFLNITSGGNLLVGTTTDSGYKLSVNGTSQMGALNLGSLGTGTVYSSSGTLTNTNPSDRRLKQNITPITYGLNEVLQLNPVSFDWKNDNNKNKQFGFIAQEVQNVMPEAVIKGEYLGLEKDAIYAAMVNAIKELKQEIETLKIK